MANLMLSVMGAFAEFERVECLKSDGSMLPRGLSEALHGSAGLAACFGDGSLLPVSHWDICAWPTPSFSPSAPRDRPIPLRPCESNLADSMPAFPEKNHHGHESSRAQCRADSHFFAIFQKENSLLPVRPG